MNYELAKHVGALAPLLLWSGIIFETLRSRFLSHHSYSSSPVARLPAPWPNVIAIAIGAWLLFGVAILTMDAFRRNYTSARSWPLALAILGAPSLGLSCVF